MKIVINTLYGGFNLTMEALQMYFDKIGKKVWLRPHSSGFVTISLVPFEESVKTTWSMEKRQENELAYYEKLAEESFDPYSIPRNDPALIHVVETLGSEKASGMYCRLKIVEIPDDVEWMIQDYDGEEWVAEKHRVWK